MNFRDCDRSHSSAILDIFNDAIANSTSIWDYDPRTPEFMETWFDGKQAETLPIVGAFENDALIGFATYGPFRRWPAYKYTVENSVYVHRESRGHGIGRKLLAELIERAKRQELHSMIAVIDSGNQASRSLHASLGFEPCGHMRQVGFKFDRWLDLSFYQLVLPTPEHPVAG